MIVVYTPDEIQNDNVLTGFETIRSPGLYLTTDDKGFYMLTPWCREGTSKILNKVFSGRFPPGRANIYNIRGGDRQQVGSFNARYDCIFNGLAQFVVELLASACDDHVWTTERVENWLGWWNRNFGTSLIPPTVVYPTTKMFVDKPPTQPQIQSVHSSPPRDNLGGWLNIPSSWLKEIPAMSFLMYLLRLWAGFYNHSILAILTKQSSYLPTSQGPLEKLTTESSENGPPKEVAWASWQLWQGVARRLMLPFWFTSYAREDFWALLYHLIHCAMEKLYYGHHEEQVFPMPSTLETSTNARYLNGFRTWCRWYMSTLHPEGSNLSVVRNTLAIYGPLAVIRFRPLDPEL